MLDRWRDQFGPNFRKYPKKILRSIELLGKKVEDFELQFTVNTNEATCSNVAQTSPLEFKFRNSMSDEEWDEYQAILKNAGQEDSGLQEGEATFAPPIPLHGETESSLHDLSLDDLTHDGPISSRLRPKVVSVLAKD